jgi:hypothetical protein
MDEESKLIEEYYKHYKQPKPVGRNRLGNPSRRRDHNDLDDMSDPGSRNSSYTRDKNVRKSNPNYGDNNGAEEMDEDERVSLIAKLEKRKQELWVKIQSLPICNRSLAVMERERVLYKQLDEVSSQTSLLSNNRILIV